MAHDRARGLRKNQAWHSNGKINGNLISEVLPNRPPKEILLGAADSLEQINYGIKPSSEHF
jgi:hypothetical protein